MSFSVIVNTLFSLGLVFRALADVNLSALDRKSASLTHMGSPYRAELECLCWLICAMSRLSALSAHPLLISSQL